MFFNNVLPILLIIGMILVFGIWWKMGSVERGDKQRNEKILKLLDPVGEKLSNQHLVNAEEVKALADKTYVRVMLYRILEHFNRLYLFPSEYLDVKSQAEGILSYWLMHPNELNDSPDKIEIVEIVKRQIDGQPADFLVLRFLKIEDKDSWELGVVGPFVQDDVPYSGRATAFSRFGDYDKKINPAELVDWYIDLRKNKGLSI